MDSIYYTAVIRLAHDKRFEQLKARKVRTSQELYVLTALLYLNRESLAIDFSDTTPTLLLHLCVSSVGRLWRDHA